MVKWKVFPSDLLVAALMWLKWAVSPLQNVTLNFSQGWIAFRTLKSPDGSGITVIYPCPSSSSSSRNWRSWTFFVWELPLLPSTQKQPATVMICVIDESSPHDWGTSNLSEHWLSLTPNIWNNCGIHKQQAGDGVWCHRHEQLKGERRSERMS